MAGRDEEPYSGVPQNWGGAGGNVPMVVVAPAPAEPSVTRGVTGLFVPIFLAVFILAAIYFFFGAWQAAQSLARQEAITRDATGLLEYMEDIERQNAALCRDWAETPERVERPNLQAQIELSRRRFDEQCVRNQTLQDRLRRRTGQGGDARCVRAQPETQTAPPLPYAAQTPPAGGRAPPARRETIEEFRDRICLSYRPASTR